MNTSPDEFEQLRKLLALKRHEQPPPRYFQEFSQQVRARLETERAPRESFRERIAALFSLQPFTAAAYGAAVCALLLVGIKFSYQSGSQTAGGTNNGPAIAGTAGPSADPLVPNNSLAAGETNPPPAGIFTPHTQPAQPVNFPGK
jgi:hypothetical protein